MPDSTCAPSLVNETDLLAGNLPAGSLAGLSIRQLDETIRRAVQEGQHQGFSGNCAAFALVLAGTLGEDAELACFDSGEHYEYVDHVAVRWRRRYFDASGQVSRRVLSRGFGALGLCMDRSDLSVLRLVDTTGGGMLSRELDCAAMRRDLERWASALGFC